MAVLSVPEGTDQIDVRVFDLAGRQVSRSCGQEPGGVFEIPCASLPVGTYILAVDTGAGTQSLRMTVLR
jgi:hypothetical protein